MGANENSSDSAYDRNRLDTKYIVSYKGLDRHGVLSLSYLLVTLNTPQLDAVVFARMDQDIAVSLHCSTSPNQLDARLIVLDRLDRVHIADRA